MSTLNRLVLSITLGLALLVLLWPALPLVQAAAPLADCLPTVTVTSAGDSDPGSLRQALADVCSGGTIDFDPGLAGQTIVLTSTELTIAKTVTITNPHASGLQLSGDNARRVFTIQAGAVVTLSHLSIISGTDHEGGGIHNSGALTINHSTFSGNSTYDNGGGIYNSGVLAINHNTFSGNSADDHGAGIFNYTSGTLMVDNSTFSGNSTLRDGGGIRNWGGTLTVDNSTFSGNSAGVGGGIDNDGTLTIDNTTFSSNSASYGGGISSSRTLLVDHSTFSGNSAGNSGGGIYNGGTLTIGYSTFNGNSATSYGGGIYNDGTLTINQGILSANTTHSGGGIYNDSYGTLTVDTSTFSANSAFGGGGIYNTSDGRLTVDHSTFNGNSTYGGGGIFNEDGTLTVNHSTFSGNSADGYGGGIDNRGTLTLNHSTFSGNSAGYYGGGIDNWGTLTLNHSTFSGNSARYYGGGISNYGTLTINHSTFSGNSATDYGGGILNYSDSTLHLRNSILANSPSGSDCVNNGIIDTNLNNLIEDGSCSPAYSGDPLLAPLADYGGPTQTLALLPGSPAIDAGETATCLPTDQRGIARPQGGGCDIGAFESQGFTLAVTGGNHQAASTGSTFAAPLGLTVTATSPSEPVDGGLVTFTAPGTGPSATFAPTTTLTIAGGAVSLPVKANLTGGAYPVSATAAGANQVIFSLTNTLSELFGVYLPLVVK